jgi:hypothetical protein
MRLFRLVALLLGMLCAATTAHSIAVSAVWQLNAGSLQNPNVSMPALITANPQALSPGSSPAMSIFDYWVSNVPQAQRLYAGSAGWTAGAVNTNRFIQFDAGPTAGNQLAITSVTFKYGGTGGAPNRMRSEVRYSVNNGPWTLLSAPLNYPTPGFNSFVANLSLAPIQAGQKFSLRIYPYAIQNQTAGSPLFAAHSVVAINGNSTPATPTAPDLQVTKVCTNQGQANQGVLCTITVKNNGTTPSIAPLTLTDLPSATAGSTFTGGGGTLPISCSPGAGPVLPITCQPINATIPPGGTATALFSFKMPNSGGTLNNCVTVTQAAAEANPANNTNICTSVTVPPLGGLTAPDLQVTKTCTTQGQANQGVLCTVSVKNNGTTPSIAPLTLTDLPTAPAGSQFTGAGGNMNPSCSPGAGAVLPINCTASAPIQPGATAVALFSFKLPPSGGTLNNCATATQGSSPGVTPEANLANNSNVCTSVVVPAVGGGADLGVTKACTLIGPNRLVRCTITVSNGGNAPSSAPWNLTETLTGLPPGSTLVSVGAGGIACPGVSLPMPMPSPMNCTIANPVVPGSPAVILVDFRLPQPATFQNCAAVAMTGPETNVANNSACTNLTVP